MICNACKKEKPESAFPFKYKSEGIRNTKCKICQRAYDRIWYCKNREEQIKRVNAKTKVNKKRADEFIYDYLQDHPCVECGEKDILVLTFHHLEPSKKRIELSTMRSMGYSLGALQKEVKKCDVLCFNCHAKKHRKDTRLGMMVARLG